MQIEIKKLENSQVEIVGELPKEDLAKFEKSAIKKIGENIELPGFRKGHIPEDILLKNVSPMAILEEMAQLALEENYPKILADKKIDAIGRPEITITKLAKDNPLGFKIKTAVFPEVGLPDYRKIAAGEKIDESKLQVTDDEVEKTVLELRRMRAKQKLHEEAGEHEDHTHDVKDEDLPELNDEFAKSLGAFSSVDDLKIKVRENMKLEKEHRSREEKRMKIAEKIISGSKIELPPVLVDFETDKMIFRLKNDLSQAGVKLEDYLKNSKKTEEDIRKEAAPEAAKRVKLELSLAEIAKKESITPGKEEIEAEVAKLLQFYKNVKPEQAKSYIENMLTNEKVFQFLESQK